MTEDSAPFDTKEAECVESALERRFIEEYLESKGYQRSYLRQLPEHEARKLMKEACKYATLKLAEIEARSKFRNNIQLPH